MQVYNVFGLGFGDDEAAWELCSTHATRESAEAARTAILADCGVPETDVQVQAQQVQQ
jgi:hypothetical protein